MNLYIGGRNQGKLDYCRSLLKGECCVVLDGAELPADLQGVLKTELPADLKEKHLILDQLHLWIRTCLEEGPEPQDVFRAFSEKARESGAVLEIISDEIGNGIVPNDPFEREWREAAGRLLREIAAESEAVVRIVCGMPQVIKKAERPAANHSNLVQAAANDRSNLVQTVQLYLIRHGAVKGNLEKRFIGTTDESLTEEGAETIRRKKEAGAYPDPRQIDILFSSPLRRCAETAAIAFPGKETVLISEWSEILFGDFEYANYLELSDDPRFQAWIDSGGEAAFPGGESKAEYCERVKRGFRTVCALLRDAEARRKTAAHTETAEGTGTGREITAAATVHLGTMKALLSALTEMGYFDVQAANGEGFLLTIDPENECILRTEAFS